MSEKEVLATAQQSSPATPEPSMTAAEALAISWTGIEALVKMKKARLFHSPRTGRVWVELSETKYEPANGLTPAVIVVVPTEKKDNHQENS